MPSYLLAEFFVCLLPLFFCCRFCCWLVFQWGRPFVSTMCDSLFLGFRVMGYVLQVKKEHKTIHYYYYYYCDICTYHVRTAVRFASFLQRVTDWWQLCRSTLAQVSHRHVFQLLDFGGGGVTFLACCGIARDVFVFGRSLQLWLGYMIWDKRGVLGIHWLL